MVDVIPDSEADYSDYVEKEYGPVIEEFIDWLGDKTGYKLDERSVFLAIRLYGNFQRSESHQDNLARKARGDSSPPRPVPKGRAAKASTGPARGKAPAAKAEPAAKASPKGRAAKAGAPKETAAKPTSKARPAGKRGAPAPY